MLEAYRKAAAERAALGIPALPLNAQQTADLVELLKNPPAGEGEFLVELLAHRVPPGVDDAAKVKASFLAAVAEGSASSPLISPEYATELLGTMLGGYNIHALIELLDNDKLAPIAANGLKHTLLMFDSFHDVQEKAEKGNKYAQEYCNPGQMPNGSLLAPKFQKKSLLPSSKSTAKPIQTTSLLHLMHGVVLIFLCTRWRC